MAEPARRVRFVAAVLTGGGSRRMGRDKASLPVGGEPMAERVARAAEAAGAEEVVFVGRPVGGGLHLPDAQPGAGPLGPVAAAIRWARGKPVVVLACDLVAPSAGAIRQAAREAAGGPGAGSDVDVAVPVAGGRDQWLHACWNPSALVPLDAALEAGERAIHRAAAPLRVRRFEAADPGAHADADTVADLPAGDR